MADIALNTPGRVEVGESQVQRFLICGVAILAGQPVYADTNGKWALANSTDAAHSTGVHIATRDCAKGESLTAIRAGRMDGFNLSGMAFNASIFLSDTGTLATVAGTVPTVLGRVEAAIANVLGSPRDKIAHFSCPL